MTHRNLKIHPAMTAIAAVIALSTPSFAQSVEAPDLTTPAPAIEATPAPVAADSLAPVPVANTPAAADPLAAEAVAKPAARKATTAKSTAARPRPMKTRAASIAPTVAAAPAVTSVPATVAPVDPLPIQAEAAPVQAPVAEPPAIADNSIDPMVPIAGFGGLGILALTGAGLIVRNRRRQRAQDADDAARRQAVETIPDADNEADPAMIVEPEPEPATPAMVAETAAVAAAVIAAHEPSPEIDGPVTELPEDFDTSQFGLHAQAAYNGPTEDNPSLSLKHRLSRANGMDQLAEREAEAEVAADAVDAPATEPAVTPPAKGDFMLGRTGTKSSREPSLRPAHSH